MSAIFIHALVAKACFYLVGFVQVQDMAGIEYNHLTGRWSLSDDVSVNFIAYGTKTVTSSL